jgi:hypothetical protein
MISPVYFTQRRRGAEKEEEEKEEIYTHLVPGLKTGLIANLSANKP